MPVYSPKDIKRKFCRLARLVSKALLLGLVSFNLVCPKLVCLKLKANLQSPATVGEEDMEPLSFKRMNLQVICRV